MNKIRKISGYVIVGIMMMLTIAMFAQDDKTKRPAGQPKGQMERPADDKRQDNRNANKGQDNRNANKGPENKNDNNGKIENRSRTKRDKAKEDSLRNARYNDVILMDSEEIPDSLLHPRWEIQKTTPVTVEDLHQGSYDLKRPENLEQKVEYNDSLDTYNFGYKIGDTYIEAPIEMNRQEYLMYVGKQAMSDYFKSKNQEIFEKKGKEKFDFTDMHFDLGPAEKIFGPGGVRIKTQGTAELKFGATIKKIDNPSLPVRSRKTTNIDFDEKININVSGKVGDKVNLGLNYNTDATFNFDQQNLKLKYEGKEDEIIKLVEGGNVSFPSNSSLVQGASSLFGIRTDMQFGKLKLQTVISQKKSNSSSVSSKGGVQLTPFELDVSDYEENRHFFLSHYFRSKYDDVMKTLPNVASGVTINRIEVWVTNKNGTTTNTRNIIALSDLGEPKVISTAEKTGMPKWNTQGYTVPANAANDEYKTISSDPYSAARNIDQTSTVLDAVPNFAGGVDYEKLERARMLSSSEYTINQSLGTISLKTTLQTDQVLAVAYEYTYGGQTFQVGEFSSDITDNNQALIVKSLKNTSNNPQQVNWPLMMKNVYYLASTVEKEKFRLDIKYQSDTTGVYLSYIPEPQVKQKTLLKLLGCDRLDNNNKAHPNGYFDYVSGYTVSNGRVFLPSAEPFGGYLRTQLINAGVSKDVAEKYVYSELYDSTKTIAKQIAEKDKFMLQGQYKGSSANVISLGAYNVPQGSVTVTAGGVTLTEGTDYSVDYSAGEVTILNQSIIDAGTNVNVSCESNTDYGQQRKTMFGINWEYDFSKDFMISGTLQHLSEQALTTKVQMGSEPLNNTLWGFNISWKKESQWLTNILDALPFLHCTAPSEIQFDGEFAQLIAGTASGTQDNASYIDDFENTTSNIDVSTPTSWIISSTPTKFLDATTSVDPLSTGYGRARLAWYNIDPLFTRKSSSLTPTNIKNNTTMLSNHYMREVYVNELYPNRDQSSYNGATSTLSILNLAYYPEERGPYNFSLDLTSKGKLAHPQECWGGMMRKLDTSDFQTANVEYIEFWLMDPFITGKNGYASTTGMGGDLYINLGEVSEDVLKDGKKFCESSMPVDGSDSFTTSSWGKIPTQASVTYAFATSSGSRVLQDVGFNGLNDAQEVDFDSYQPFRKFVEANIEEGARDSILADLANDDYRYCRSNDWDNQNADILTRYKYINNPQGNSPDADNQDTSYDSSYKTSPDVEDINQDYTLNEYEKYFQYKVHIAPGELSVGSNYIVDKRTASVKLRNGDTDEVNWYQFRIPLSQYDAKIGSISDFTSIRFMRMFLTEFKQPIVLRFGSLDLVRGEWRIYEQNLNPSAANTGKMVCSNINIEENNDKTPVNYVLPPGISRVVDPSQPQLTENNEQALKIDLSNLSTQEAKCVYKNTTLDLRNYKHLQMFVHANATDPNTTNLQDNQLALFFRLGSDYKSNYYEYEIPLKLTPPGYYDTYSADGCKAVWPEENMLDIDLTTLTSLKKERNKAKADGKASYNQVYTGYDSDNPNNKISVIGNPTLGEVKTMIIGVRNLAADNKSGEVWCNELRLKDPNNEGGWAAQGNLNVKLSDLGSVNLSGKYTSSGFGGLEQGIMERSTDSEEQFSATVNLDLGKFFPDKAKVTAPVYYSVTKQKTSPKYNPLDTDMKLKDALDAAGSLEERDSIESIAVTKTVNTNFSVSGLKVGIQTKGHPMPYDPANFSFSYSHSHNHTSGETTVYENEDQWNGAMHYAWSPVYKSWEPFKNIKSKSKYFDILKRFGLNWLPQSIAFNTEMKRNYYELQERDMEATEDTQLPVTFSEQFLWNRDFSLRWDLTKNLHFNFQSATHAEIEEPYTVINKDLYPDRYEAWKDSVWTSIKHFGTPLDYSQNVSASYQLPLNLIPIFDWLTADGTYSSTYNWVRGTENEDGSNYGNTIAMTRTLGLNGSINLEKLYNHIPFLKKVNEKFSKSSTNANRKKNSNNKKDNKKDNKNSKDDKNSKDKNKQTMQKELPKNINAMEKELVLFKDSMVELSHGKKSKRISVTAKTAEGKYIPVHYKVMDDNKIKICLKRDSTMKVKVTVVKKPDLEEQGWYKVAQYAARFLMMARTASFTYHNTYQMSLPGFMNSVGDCFGQKKIDGMWSPGLDFAFGFIDDSYIDKANERDWLLNNDSVATPAVINRTEDLQLKMTLEPFKNFKIDLNASYTRSKNKSIQYMYVGNPTTESGALTMTTLSLRSAFEGIGNANNGFHSASFDKFCAALPEFQKKVEARYAGTVYPADCGSEYAGRTFNPTEVGTVSQYSSDVMIPAFLSTYTSSSGSGLKLFPVLTSILPNWSVRYSGLSQLPWFRDNFKSVNINHAYKSIYAIGSYSTYSSWVEYMGGLGFVANTAGVPIPSSMYNISQVSINEAFSPLLGIDVTLNNNMSLKLEYKTTRVLSLSMTSVQITEALSKDWVFGFGYKIQDFKFFGGGNHRQVKNNKKAGKGSEDENANAKKNSSSTKSKGISHDLNLRLDLSYRRQASINRDIQSQISTATSGNNAFKLSFTADYTMSKLLTMSFYLDRQTNTPLLSSNSYPTTTQDFGLSLKFSLTR